MDLPWAQLIVGGPVLMLCGLIFYTTIRLAPTWEKVRLKKIDSDTALSCSIGLLANAANDSGKVRIQEIAALHKLADVVASVAVEQRKAIETVRIMQRVQADSSDKLSDALRELSERVAALEQMSPTNYARPKANSTPAN
jgi:hypothetical protein